MLVIGLARSGLAAVECLLRRGARVLANDRKPVEELPPRVLELAEKGVELVTGSHPAGLVSDVDLVVLSPGVPMDVGPLKEAREQGVPIWGELELAFREIEGSVVAVTGTKGKSTTATLIADIVRRDGRPVVLGGNIGQPLIGLVEKTSKDSFVVVEVSSFQLEATDSFRPRVADLSRSREQPPSGHAAGSAGCQESRCFST